MPNIPIRKDVEGFGLAALEASSAGLPVVAAKLEGIQDAVKDGKNGFLMEPLDIQGFVSVIMTLLGDGKRKEEIGRDARMFTLKNYSWQEIARRYCQEFKKVMKEKWNYDENSSGK